LNEFGKDESMEKGKKHEDDQGPEPEKSVPPPTDSNEGEPSEILSQLDDYQQRIESDWENTKSSYQSKINNILDQFIKDKLKSNEKDLSIIFPNEPEKKSKATNLENLMSKAQKVLHPGNDKARRLAYKSLDKPSIVDIDWASSSEKVGATNPTDRRRGAFSSRTSRRNIFVSSSAGGDHSPLSPHGRHRRPRRQDRDHGLVSKSDVRPRSGERPSFVERGKYAE